LISILIFFAILKIGHTVLHMFDKCSPLSYRLMPVIGALGKQRWEDRQFQASLGYIQTSFVKK
jgi:hypothetical protein